MTERRLTTTAYGILGVLAIQPRTAYELSLEMRHCFEYFWARDDVRVYSEAKRLASLGLIASERQMIGRRPRTKYRLLAPGRRRLQRWLKAPSRPVGLEFEGLVKVYLARFGTLDDLRATVRQVEADAGYMLQVATNVRGVYLDRCAPFQDEYVHVWAFVYDFLSGWFRYVHSWAEQTLADLDGWRDLSPEDKRARAMGLFERKVPAEWLAPDPLTPIDGVPALPGLWARRAGRLAERAYAEGPAARPSGLPTAPSRRTPGTAGREGA